jgi:hypothetical protein
VAGSCNFELCPVAEAGAWPRSCSPPSSSIPQEQVVDTFFDRRPDDVGLRIMFVLYVWTYIVTVHTREPNPHARTPYIRAGILAAVPFKRHPIILFLGPLGEALPSPNRAPPSINFSFHVTDLPSNFFCIVCQDAHDKLFVSTTCCWRANVHALTAFVVGTEWSGLNVDTSLASGYGGNIDVNLHFHPLRPQISRPILAELAEFRNLTRVGKFGRRVSAS